LLLLHMLGRLIDFAPFRPRLARFVRHFNLPLRVAMRRPILLAWE
jgi:hypothetical protein